MKVSAKGKKYIYDFENATDDDNELHESGHIDLSKAALHNTEVKRVEKTVLPIGSIMDDILEKDLSGRTYKVNNLI